MDRRVLPLNHAERMRERDALGGVAGMGLALYIIHTILLNHFLGKNAPEMTKSGRSKGNQKERKIRIEAVSYDDVPRWVILIGFPSMPLFLLGILIVIIAFVFRLLG